MDYLWWLCIIYVTRTLATNLPRVVIDQGELEGKYLTTRGGRSIATFLGIPYALAPLKELRFKNPQPPLSWEGVRQAKRDGSKCVQQDVLDYKHKNRTAGNEDCLFINVFTPTLDSTAKLAVIVFIHGGGFYEGSSSSLVYGPEFLLDKDVVLVSMNYRLGVLGFMSTEDNELPGNLGLKDQTASLQWVQSNIHFFGGDKNSVTIMGHSAGSVSVHLHMMSPLSKGLFHGAISMSGVGLCPWAIHPPGNYLKLTQRVAADFGCPTGNTKDMVECLRYADAYNLTTVLARYEIFDLDPALLFPPIVEANTTDAFLVQDPWSVKTTIPWIIGFVSEEGSLRAASLLRNEGVTERLHQLDTEYKVLLPMSIMVEMTARNPVYIAEKVRRFYFGNEKIDINHSQEIINMYSDSWFDYASAESVLRHAGDVFHYYFSYKGKFSVGFQFGDNTKVLGVVHGDILIYLFPLEGLFVKRFDTEEDLLLSLQLVEWWTNFAYYRDPTPEGNPPIKWNAVTTADREYMSINNSGLVMDKNAVKERYDFWKALPYRDKPVPEM
uniref:Carboxylic ester hydrolase n=1 Tax=Clastoptera arizonana TaxID=38151 RepID=A0A1B6CZ18_9HEMI